MTGEAGGLSEGRLLLFVPWEFDMLGGVDVVVDRLWRELECTKPGQALIGIQDWTFEGEKSDATGRRFLHVNFPAPSSGRPLAPRYLLTVLRRLPVLLRQLRQHDIRIGNFHFPRLNVYPLALLKRLGFWRGRIVLSFHGSDVHEIDAASPTWRFIARQTDAVTACSDALARRIEALGLFDRERIKVVHNGIDSAHFQATPGDSGIVSGTSFILNIGNYVPRKAQNVLLEAFAQIAGRFPDLKLVFAGGIDNGKWLASLHQLVAERGVAERVVFLENIPQRQVADLMRQATCLAHAALDEPFGLVVIEAGACRLPVVATRVGGIPEIIPSDEFGALVEADEVEALAAALDDLLRRPEAAAARARRFQARVFDTFSVAAMTKGYMKVLWGRC